MATLKVGDHNEYHIKPNTIKLFYIKQAVNGERQIFYLVFDMFIVQGI